MYEIILTDIAKKQLSKLERHLQDRITKTLERLRIRPEAHIKKLVDDPGYSIRIGDYRVILDIDNKKLIILVLKLGHRKNIYD